MFPSFLVEYMPFDRIVIIFASVIIGMVEYVCSYYYVADISWASKLHKDDSVIPIRSLICEKNTSFCFIVNCMCYHSYTYQV